MLACAAFTRGSHTGLSNNGKLCDEPILAIMGG